MSGWISLHRVLLRKKIWQEGTLATKVLLVTLLLMASFTDKIKRTDRGRDFYLAPGQVFCTERELEKSSGINRQQIRTALKALQKCGFLEIDTNGSNGTLLTVVNFAEYQGFSEANPKYNDEKPYAESDLSYGTSAANPKVKAKKTANPKINDGLRVIQGDLSDGPVAANPKPKQANPKIKRGPSTPARLSSHDAEAINPKLQPVKNDEAIESSKIPVGRDLQSPTAIKNDQANPKFSAEIPYAAGDLLNSTLPTNQTECEKPINYPQAEAVIRVLSLSSQTVVEGKTKKGVRGKKPQKINFADNIKMLQSEFDTLVNDHGEAAAREIIKIVSDYKAAYGKSYKDDYRAIVRWGINAYEERRNRQNGRRIAGNTGKNPVDWDAIAGRPDVWGMESDSGPTGTGSKGSR